MPIPDSTDWHQRSLAGSGVAAKVVLTVASWSLLFLVSIGSFAAAGDLRLVDAVKNQDQQAIRSLLKEKVNVNTQEPDGATALAWAAHWNDLETADLLLQAGANANTANDFGVTPLSLACTNASAPMVEKLVKAGANPNAAQASGVTVLMTCSRTGNAAAVQLLLDRGADVNAKESSKHQTALMWAIAEKHPAVAKILVDHKAEIEAKSTTDFTPLLFAAQQGDVDSARLLLDAGANVNEVASGGMSPLLIASASGQGAVAALLLDKGAEANAADPRGYTATHYAAQNRNLVELLKALFAHGADPNARLTRSPGGGADDEGALSLVGATPFILAANAGNAAAMRALAAGGADPNLATKDKTTALMLASGVGKYEDRGPVPTRNALECAKVAVDLGADVNAAGPNGWTPLHGAAYTGSDAIIQLLVSKGAHLDTKDRFGQTPLSIAEAVITKGLGEDADIRPRRRRESTVTVLLQSGATPTARAGVEQVGSLAVVPTN